MSSTVIYILIGHMIGAAILSAWYNWKKNRPVVRMVQNRKGEFVDAADRFEKLALIWLWVFIVSFVSLFVGYTVFFIP